MMDIWWMIIGDVSNELPSFHCSDVSRDPLGFRACNATYRSKLVEIRVSLVICLLLLSTLPGRIVY